MAEQKFESKIVQAQYSAGDMYAVLSDMRNIDKVKNLFPQDKIKDITCDQDSVSFKVDGLGQKVCIKVEDREENKTVKFGLAGMPMQANFWIQLLQVAEQNTRLRLTIKADIPTVLKMMMRGLDDKIQKGLDDAADMLAQFPYTAMK